MEPTKAINISLILILSFLYILFSITEARKSINWFKWYQNLDSHIKNKVDAYYHITVFKRYLLINTLILFGMLMISTFIGRIADYFGIGVFVISSLFYIYKYHNILY